jgi:hypothetical protein
MLVHISGCNAPPAFANDDGQLALKVHPLSFCGIDNRLAGANGSAVRLHEGGCAGGQGMAGFLGMGSVIEAHAKNARALHRAQQAHLVVVIDLFCRNHRLKGHTAQTTPLGGLNLLSVMDIFANGIARNDHICPFMR